MLPAWLPIAQYLLVIAVGRLDSLHFDQDRHVVDPCSNLFCLLFYPDTRNYFFRNISAVKECLVPLSSVSSYSRVLHLKARCLFVIGRRLIPAPTIPYTRCRKYFHSSLIL